MYLYILNTVQTTYIYIYIFLTLAGDPNTERRKDITQSDLLSSIDKQNFKIEISNVWQCQQKV